ncbi:MAG TPA: hypothetical protein VM183_00310 [Burkholderiales bacterium]|nr:hypothetical protein [Burkholderiales bacterium]
MNSTTALLILHGLCAVALLGAITHQAASVLLPARRPAGSFAGRFRAVPAASYANAIVLLYIVTGILGAIVYAEYRISVRTVIEQLEQRAANGSFELKEHFAAIGLGLLPVYWHYWRAIEHSRARTAVTVLLAFIVWWSFLVGHVVNNIRGFGG